MYLEDIVSAAQAVAAFVGGREAAGFSADDLTRSAVLFKLVVIGEAASKISRELRAQHPEVPWQDMVSFRNLAVHACFGVDWSIVWTTATEDLPPLLGRLTAILADSKA